MKKEIKHLLQSFKDKNLYKTFAIDGIAIALMVASLTIFSKLLAARAYAISGGKTTEELKIALLAGVSEVNQALISNLKIFFFAVIIGTIIVLILNLVIFAYSRSLIWSLITKKQKFRKWNWMILASLLISLVYLLITTIIKLIQSQIPMGTYYQTVSAITTFIFILIYLIFIFMIFNNFSHSYKVWESIGHTFHTIKIKWKKIPFIQIIVVGAVVTLLSYLLQRMLYIQAPWLFTTSLFVLNLLYIDWIRIYLVKKLSL